MWKCRFFIDEEKEEQWINDMSQQGWHLKKCLAPFFKFEKGVAGEYIYRNEFLENGNPKEYFEFLEASHIEVVTRFFRWMYVRKLAAEGPFELYSDPASKLSYYTRLKNVFLYVLLLNILIGIINLSFSISDGFMLNGIVSMFNFGASVLVALPLTKYIKRSRKLKEEI